ncbi:MAG: hypothetical protein IJF07_01275, partial [Lachnospiraceae bacterium]|nr:hypothetical protein [Lachnospiraceae bacterium]
MKKKVISMLVSVIMVMSIAACGTRVNGEFTETAEALQADGNSNTETTEIPQADGNSNTEATEILQADGNSNTEAPGETKEYLVDAAFLISEQKLQEHRESYFEACGFPDNYESAYETLDRQQSPCYYRKDQQITSYSFKNGWDFSFTCDTMTKTKLQLKDILVKEEQFWAEAKTYMLEQIGQRAGHYSKVAESYQDIINSMEASTAQWDWYLDAGGLVIYFHPYILFNNYESCEFVFSYADWQEHIKGEYQVGVEPIVARISPNVPYPVTEKESLSFVYYPDSDYTITIQAGEEELTLEGFDFEAPYGYILRETPDIVYLLLETDECMDLDERIWLFKIENGVLTQCGETMHGKLIYVDSTASIVLEELVYSPSSFEEYVAVNDFDEIPL